MAVSVFPLVAIIAAAAFGLLIAAVAVAVFFISRAQNKNSDGQNR